MAMEALLFVVMLGWCRRASIHPQVETVRVKSQKGEEKA